MRVTISALLSTFPRIGRYMELIGALFVSALVLLAVLKASEPESGGKDERDDSAAERPARPDD